MTAPYVRPPGASQQDYAAARATEELVADTLRAVGPLVTNLDSPTKLDFQRLGWTADLKEKKQPLTDRWALLGETPLEDLFVIDELAVRKTLDHYPASFMLLHDRPLERWFLAPSWELVSMERARRDRNKKAKLIFRMTDFTQVDGPVHAEKLFLEMLVAGPWKHGPAVGHTVPAQV